MEQVKIQATPETQLDKSQDNSNQQLPTDTLAVDPSSQALPKVEENGKSALDKDAKSSGLDANLQENVEGVKGKSLEAKTLQILAYYSFILPEGNAWLDRIKNAKPQKVEVDAKKPQQKKGKKGQKSAQQTNEGKNGLEESSPYDAYLQSIVEVAQKVLDENKEQKSSEILVLPKIEALLKEILSKDGYDILINSKELVNSLASLTQGSSDQTLEKIDEFISSQQDKQGVVEIKTQQSAKFILDLTQVQILEHATVFVFQFVSLWIEGNSFSVKSLNEFMVQIKSWAQSHYQAKLNENVAPLLKHGEKDINSPNKTKEEIKKEEPNKDKVQAKEEVKVEINNLKDVVSTNHIDVTKEIKVVETEQVKGKSPQTKNEDPIKKDANLEQNKQGKSIEKEAPKPAQRTLSEIQAELKQAKSEPKQESDEIKTNQKLNQQRESKQDTKQELKKDAKVEVKPVSVPEQNGKQTLKDDSIKVKQNSLTRQDPKSEIIPDFKQEQKSQAQFANQDYSSKSKGNNEVKRQPSSDKVNGSKGLRAKSNQSFVVPIQKKLQTSAQVVTGAKAALEFYQKRILINDIKDDFKEVLSKNPSLFIALTTKNQVVLESEATDYKVFKDTKQMKKHIKANGYKFKQIEKIEQQSEGVDSVIYSLSITQPIEVAIKVPLPQKVSSHSDITARNLIKEGHLVKLLANKENVPEILEEIIEYNQSKDQIVSYIQILEQAKTNLLQTISIWEDEDHSYISQEHFSEEKLFYFCLKTMEALQYIHSKNVYYGGMNPQNVQIFKDLSVKLGDFGLAIKLQEQTQNDEEYKMKGITTGYTTKQILKKCDAGKVKRSELINNDYYGLYKTCKILLNMFKDNLKQNGYLEKLVADLRILKNTSITKQNDLKDLVNKYQELLSNDQEFILKLADQIIQEEKLNAIANILKLSKFKHLMSDISHDFIKKEYETFAYLKWTQYSEIAEDKELFTYYHSLANQETPKDEPYYPRSLLSQDDFLIQNIVTFDQYLQRLLSTRGPLCQNYYKKYLFDKFQGCYYLHGKDYNVTWDNLLSMTLNQLKVCFLINKKAFERFCQFVAISTSGNNEVTSQKVRLLLKVLKKIAKPELLHVELALILTFGKQASQCESKLYFKNLQKLNQRGLDLLTTYDVTKYYDAETIKSFEHSLMNSFILEAVAAKSVIPVFSKADLSSILRKFKNMASYENFKIKSSYSQVHQLKSKLAEKTTMEQIASLLQERKLYSNTFGEQGTPMTKNAFKLFQLYKKVSESDSDEANKEETYSSGLKFLKKAANHCHKSQKAMYLSLLADEYHSKQDYSKMMATISHLATIDPVYEVVMLTHYNNDLELNEQQKKNSINKLRDYSYYAEQQEFFNSSVKFQKMICELIGVQFKENRFSNLYLSWLENQEFLEFEAYSHKQLIFGELKKIVLATPSKKSEPASDKGKITYENGTVYEGQILNNRQNGEGTLTYFDGRIAKGHFEGNHKHGQVWYSFPGGNIFKCNYKHGLMDGKCLFYFSDGGSQQITYVDGKKQGYGFQSYANKTLFEGEFENDKRSGQGIVKYPNSEVYQGNWSNDKLSGQGQYGYLNGDVHKGEFQQDQRNGYGNCVYANGDVYDGDWNQDQRNGQGKCWYANGDVYDGEWHQDQRNGAGKCSYQNGDMYVGTWNKDFREGIGRCSYSNGDAYEGLWHQDARNGAGKCTYANKEIYEGEWHKDQRNGQGVCKYANGDDFEGYWYQNNRDGLGKYTYANGDVYEGKWNNDLKYQQGKCSYANGDVYEGEWNKDHRFQQGKCVYANGDIYEGCWSKDKREGQGKCIYANGDVYEGKWHKDQRVGQGKCTYANGDLYDGKWNEDQRNGSGKCIYANGDVYEGKWKKDKRDRQGQCSYANGNMYDGKWNRDQREGQGRCNYANGDLYQGAWIKDQREGSGKCDYANGDVYEGMWNKDLREGVGKCVCANKDVYEGHWFEDKRNGSGKCNYANGNFYDGQWKDDNRSALGKCIYANGNVYEGLWLLDQMCGQGKCNYANKDVYQGEWDSDQRCGLGKCTYVNGDVYEGQWDLDQRCGQGKCFFVNRDVYNGEWDKDLREGQGKCRYANGNFYDGEWVQDKRTGKGKCNFTNGDVYDGEWFKNQRYKGGKCIYANGDLYQGDWFKDQRSGQGKCTYANGDVYTGEWLVDKRNGQGHCSFHYGDAYEGKWYEDRRDGQGKCTFQNGDIYDGKWHNDIRYGQGKCLYANGDEYDGEWNNDQRDGQGLQKYGNKDVYDGEWLSDQRNGLGKIVYSNGQIYDGIWSDDCYTRK